MYVCNSATCSLQGLRAQTRARLGALLASPARAARNKVTSDAQDTAAPVRPSVCNLQVTVTVAQRPGVQSTVRPRGPYAAWAAARPVGRPDSVRTTVQ